jgi:TolB protein
MRYDSGKRRSRLFSLGERRRLQLPASLVILAILLVLFALVTPSRFNPGINPGNVRVPPFTPTPTPLPRPTDVHGGDIVFTCTRKGINQICMIKADGSGYQQLTDGTSNSYYPAISPEGGTVVFAMNRGDNFDLHELTLRVLVAPQAFAPTSTLLTDNIGNAYSPSYSPDGAQILFLNRVGDEPSALWTMGSNGENPHRIYTPPRDIVGASWSPDGNRVALTMVADARFSYQVFLLDLHGAQRGLRQLSHGLSGVGGSISWSPDQKSLLIFAGPVAAREIYRLDADSGSATQLTYGGNNASPAYSPDGHFVVFNSLRNQGQADLYIMRSDGHSMRQLTSNPEPDWQPQWAP